MTVTTLTNTVTYVGNDSTVDFDFTFPLFSVNDLVVTLTTIATGAQTTLLSSQYDLDYVESGGLITSGTVTYPKASSPDAPLTAATRITIQRILPLNQTTVLNNQSGFSPRVVEQTFDRILMQVQQVQAEVTSLGAPGESAVAAAVSATEAEASATASAESAVAAAGSATDAETSKDTAVAAASHATLMAAQAEAARIAVENVAAGFSPVTWWSFQTLYRSAAPATKIQWLANVGWVWFDVDSASWKKGSDNSDLVFGEGLLPSWFTAEANGLLVAEYLDMVAVKSGTLAQNKILSLADAVTDLSGVAVGSSTYRFPTTAIPGWTGTAFTIFSQHDETARVAGVNELLATLSDGTTANRAALGNSVNGVNQDVYGQVFSGGVAVAGGLWSGAPNTANNLADGNARSALAVALDDMAIAVAGTLANTDTSGAVPVGLDRVIINGNAVSALQPWTGDHTTAIFPRRISNADITTRTA